jgi:hypothetical protein
MPEWYIGAYFSLFPARYLYWILLNTFSILSANYDIVIKMTFFISYPVSVLLSYLVSRELYKNRFSALCSSLIYVYAPYRFSWLSTEAVWSLSLYYALNPIVFYTLLRTLNKVLEGSTFIRIIRSATIAAIALTLIILTHPQAFVVIAGSFYLIFTLIYVFIHVFLSHCKSFAQAHLFERILHFVKYFIYSIIPFILALAFTAFWWLPALSESRWMGKRKQERSY